VGRFLLVLGKEVLGRKEPIRKNVHARGGWEDYVTREKKEGDLISNQWEKRVGENKRQEWGEARQGEEKGKRKGGG